MKHPLINIAVRAARTAGNIIIRALDRLDTVQVSEKSPYDYVTDIDKQAEREIIAVIRKAYPDHGIIGEEGGETAGNEFTWIIDPLDGTRNFIHGVPHFCVSIAISHKGKIEHGVIYDPVRQELFTASRGKGAQVNDRRMRVSKRSNPNECLLGTGSPHTHNASETTAYMNSLSSVLESCKDIRRAGSAALDLAYVAAGRYDGFWEMGLNLWDIAAGSLMVKEAGGLVSDFKGAENYLKTGNIVAGNPKVLKLLLQSIGPHLGNIG
ncbi:MAG: inositol monophosphatase family protein [Gammaproteobacteria bacterium]|nr:inositol monophosphatase family protein [Gammaproteobacteria bacterium]